MHAGSPSISPDRHTYLSCSHDDVFAVFSLAHPCMWLLLLLLLRMRTSEHPSEPVRTAPMADARWYVRSPMSQSRGITSVSGDLHTGRRRRRRRHRWMHGCVWQMHWMPCTQQLTSHKSQVTSHKSQGTRHKAQGAWTSING
jgi:hypothetical protein